MSRDPEAHTPESGSSPPESGASVPESGSSAPESGPSFPGRLTERAVDLVRPVLLDKVERDHRQTDAQFMRRRIVTGITIVVGATVLGFSFSTEPGDPLFYPLTFALAVVWIIGSLVSGPLHVGQIMVRDKLRRPIITPILIGLLLAGIFAAGGLVIRYIPPLAGFTEDVLGYARFGNLALVALITLINGIAEELFFRGALFAAIGIRHPVMISTILYALATIAGGNPVLVFAAAVLGAVTGLERRASGGVLAPILTHLTWSMTMLFTLPLIFPG